MATATLEKAKGEVDVTPEVGEDGFAVAYRDGVAYSLKPYPEDERPLYWNPLYPGCEMTWRAETANRFGFFPIIQREAWTDGKFRPRNDYERHMTRQWMMQTLEGCNDPDKWLGTNHPDGADAEWTCECTWRCGNWHAFRAHVRYLRHKESSEVD